MTLVQLPPGASWQQTQSGLPLLHLTCTTFDATLTLAGGQLLQYQQRQGKPLLYLSPQAKFAYGAAIRGGIPLCWPWFGAHPHDTSLPQHGMARTHKWSLTEISAQPDGFMVVLSGPKVGDLSVEVCYTLTQQVKIELRTYNRGTTTQACSAALHSYLAISNAAEVNVQGLAGARYIDKVTGLSSRHQQDSLSCKGEIDRIVYTDQVIELVDQAWHRRTRIETQGSASVVLWNPGPIKSQALKDLPDEGWRDFFCIEASNAEEDARNLAPGTCHILGTQLNTIPL